ncbi:MAG: TetR/AcrR family transcriptional regulator [Candidatus Limnocylindrales bacterium]
MAILPRKYELGKRAIQQADTRRRIIDAALALYREQGVSATTMLDVARRADVAPGTVANHFGSAAALATEATVEILAELRMPTPELFDGVDRLADRVHLLVRELAAFFERSEPWWRVSQREPADAEFWADAEKRYYGELGALVGAALGPLADDADAVAVVSSVLGTWVIGTIQATGRSAETAVSLVSDLLATWLATRDADGPSATGMSRPTPRSTTS